MLAFGGQTAINLAAELSRRGVRIIGSDRASPRHGRGSRAVRCGARAPGRRAPARASAARSFREARAIARELGFPVLVRPSFVLGGRAMEIVYNEGQLASYAESAPPILARRAAAGRQVSARASKSKSTRSSTATTSSFPGIFEHIERAGIHSGDSISVYPTQTIDAAMERRIVDVTTAIARELGIRGLINIQFVVHDGRALHHRGQPARQPHGADHSEGDRHQHRRGRNAHRARREAARHGVRHRACIRTRRTWSSKFRSSRFRRCAASKRSSGPEMKSTGEVLGIDDTFAGALAQRVSSAPASACRERGGRILVSIADEEKSAAVPVLRRYADLGLHAGRDAGHARACSKRPGSRAKPSTRSPTVRRTCSTSSRRERSIWSSTTPRGPREISDNYRIRRAAVEASIACLTSLDTARALAKALASKAGPPRSLQEYRSGARRRSAVRRRARRTSRASSSSAATAARWRSSTAFVPEAATVTARLVPVAWTPLGVVDRRRVAERRHRAFGSARLGRPDVSAGRRARVRRADARHRTARAHRLERARSRDARPTSAVLNIEDVPDDVADALAQPPARDRAMRRLPAPVRARTTSSGKRSSCARGTITRKSSASAVRGATAPTRSGTSRRCRPARTSRRRCSTRSASRSCSRPTRSTKPTARAIVNVLLDADPRARAPGRAHRAAGSPCCASTHRRSRRLTNRAIAQLAGALRRCSSLVLAARQAYVQVVAGAGHRGATRTTRATPLLDADRGRILATDGTRARADAAARRAHLSARRGARADRRLLCRRATAPAESKPPTIAR